MYPLGRGEQVSHPFHLIISLFQDGSLNVQWPGYSGTLLLKVLTSLRDHPRGRPSIHRNPGWGFRSRPCPDAGAALSIGVISCQATVSESRPRTWIQKVVNKVSVCRAGRRRIYTRSSPHFEGNLRSDGRDESAKRCYHLEGSQDELSFATSRYYLRYLIKML